MSRIVDVEVFPLEIPFTQPFLLSRGFVGAPGKPGEHVYLRLTTAKGDVGWGEARPMPTWSYETLESVTSTLRMYIAPLLLGNDCRSPRAIRRTIDSAITPSISASQPFAISAVEQALFDLLGREADQPLHRMLGGALSQELELSYMVSGQGDSLIETAAEMADEGFSCFKVKIAGDPEEDARKLEALSAAVGDARIWADANQAYSATSVRRLLARISGIPNIVCLEQPVPTHDYPGLRRASRHSVLPIAADESIFTHHDMQRIGGMEAADLAVLKLAKSGILTNLKIAAVAESHGIDLLGSGMTESGVGFAASLHLFSTLPMVLPVDTNGPQFLSDLLVEGLRISGPKVAVPDGPGLGVTVREGKLEEFASSKVDAK